jgi:hypothetical protein
MAKETKSEAKPGAKFLVSCDFKTPVNNPSMEIVAESEAEALAAFLEANGLVASDRPITVQPL